VQSALNVSVEVAAFSIDKVINRKVVGKELSRLIKEDIKRGLANCPTWVVDRVIE
jgi:hypothetical protein